MTEAPLSEHVRRFVLTSIPSVPHLEALLLLRREIETRWDAQHLAARLYIGEKKAGDILSDLSEAGLVEFEVAESITYRYRCRSAEMADLVNGVAEAYTKNLVEVTNLIHGRSAATVQDFADAFRFRRD